MMIKGNVACALVLIMTACLSLSCSTTETAQPDIVGEPFPEAQAEIHSVLDEIYEDAKAADVAGLMSIHLDSPKFTKFGPRRFERQTVQETNKSEAEFFSSISNLVIELKDVKIDVFGDVAIATYYPHFSFERESKEVSGSSRQTLVFLKTQEGWKIIHEHGTPKREGEGQQNASQ